MKYQHGSGRIQYRGRSGRFGRNTLSNMFGLGTQICPNCGRINPYQEHTEKPPEICECGYTFASGTTYQQELNLLILLG